MQDDRYIFCPNCGALMQDGVCINCGYGAEADKTSDAQGQPENDGNRESQPCQGGAEYSSYQESQSYPGGAGISPNQEDQPYHGDAGTPLNQGDQSCQDNAGTPLNQEDRPCQDNTGTPLNQGDQSCQGNIGYLPNQGGQPYQGNAGTPPNQGGQPYQGNAGTPPNQGGQPYQGNAGTPPNQGGQPYQGNAVYPPNQGGQSYQGNGGYQQYQNGQPFPNNTGYQQNSWQYQNRNSYQQEYQVILPEKNKGNNRVLAAVIVSVIAVLACFAMVLVFLLVKSAVEEGSSFSHSRTTDTYSGDRKDKGDSFPGYGSYSHESGVEKESEEDYVPSAEDEYYVTMANAVRDDLSYSIKWEDFDYKDDETRAAVKGRYPQLEGGNIPNLEALNEQIETSVTYFRDYYGYYKQGSGSDFYYDAESIAYVTYMDEEQISVVISDHFSSDSGAYVSLYSININLLSGKVLDNGQMIDYTEELAKAFRKQNERQNSRSAKDTLELLDDSELQDFLSDPDTNIIFYTPVGLEIGFNYTTENSSGWITATIKEYERYLKKI